MWSKKNIKTLNRDDLVRNLDLRLEKACRDYIDAVERKHALKVYYKEEAAKGQYDLVTALGRMSADMRYKIAKDDWLDAMLEMNATSNAIRELREMTYDYP